MVAIEVEAADLFLEDLLRPVADGQIQRDTQIGRRAEQAIPERVIIIEDRIYSITRVGIAVHEIDTWDRVEFVEYPVR